MNAIQSLSVPQRFEALLHEDPSAPAVVLVRPGAPDRVWVRAAVEHRAIRLGGVLCHAGLPPHARLAFVGQGALDRMATAYFTLATGRILVQGVGADHTIDDEFLKRCALPFRPYALGCVARSFEPAAALPEPLTHAELVERLVCGPPIDSPMGETLSALLQGASLVVEAEGDLDAARALIYAACAGLRGLSAPTRPESVYAG